MAKVKFIAQQENLAEMLEFVLQGIKEINPENEGKLLSKVRLACEEALVNIINYAYEDGEGEVEIEYNYSKKENLFIIKLIDQGIPFNPLAKEDPDIDLPMEDREIGGLGILMIKNSMDEVVYRREEGKNILQLSKKIAPDQNTNLEGKSN